MDAGMNEVRPGDILTRLQKENELLKMELAEQIKIDRVNANREAQTFECLDIAMRCIRSGTAQLKEDWFENWDAVVEMNEEAIRDIVKILERK